MDILKKQLEINEALVSERFKTMVDMQKKYKSVNVITSIYEADYLKATKASKDIIDKINELHQEKELAEELDRELGLDQELPPMKRKNPDITKINPVAKRPRRISKYISEEETSGDEEEPVDLTDEVFNMSDENEEQIDVVSSDDEEEDADADADADTDDWKNYFDSETKLWYCPLKGCECYYQQLGRLNLHFNKKHPKTDKPDWIGRMLKRDHAQKYAVKSKRSASRGNAYRIFQNRHYDIIMKQTPNITMAEAKKKIAQKWSEHIAKK